jgi:hypothetical protein
MNAKDDSTFRFTEAVQTSFEFLSEHGFACVSASACKVRYESPKVYLEVSHGEWDREVSISFGRVKNHEEFSFTLYLRLIDPDFERALGERLANNADEVRHCVAKIAEALRSRGGPIISGQDSMFERMRDVRWWDFQPDAVKDS